MTVIATGLTAHLANRPVLHGLDFTIGDGEFVGLIGPNGAGKSTLLRVLAGLLPHGGTVTLSGEPLQRISAARLALRIGYLAQTRDVAWGLPLADVVALGRLPHRAPFAGESAADRTAIDRALATTGLDALRDRPADALSGGETARMLLARVLAQETPIVLADEPTAGLDPAHQVALMQTFAGLARDGRSIVASLHDLGIAARWCDRLILLDHGRIVADGPPVAVLTAERLAEVYGIEAHIDHDANGLIIAPTRLIARSVEVSP